MTILRFKQIPCKPTDLLLVVEAVYWNQHKSATNCGAYALFKPVAVVIGNQGNVRALDMNTKEEDLAYLQQLPELRTTIASFLNRSSQLSNPS